MKLFALAVIPFLSFSNVFGQNEPQKAKDLLMKADIEFSRLSEEKGSNEAFLKYASDSAVLLRKNSYPIEGKPAITKLLTSRPDTSFTLVWKPMSADVASSGEMGYTYGTYEIKTPGGIKTVGEGTYVTIWKKDSDGNWKFVLDAGNEGLRPKKQ